MLEINESNYSTETSSGVVVLDFYADWCGPCRALSPTLEKITGAKICKVNVDHNQKLALDHEVSAIPKLVFMKDGKVVDSMTGVSPQSTIQAKVDALNDER